MDETKQDDTADRGETRPLRIPRPDQGETTDILCAAGHAYQVVYAQESSWLFYLRLTTIDGNDTGIVRIFLGTKGSPGSRGWSGDAKFFPATREQQ